MPLAAILTFSDRVIYRGCASLRDQALAGAIMWPSGIVSAAHSDAPGFAVLHSGWVNLSGFLAWMAWTAVQQGARLIVHHQPPAPSSAVRETHMHDAASQG